MRGTSTPELLAEPGPERVRADSIMSLPMKEKVLDAVAEETDFFSRARGDGGRTYSLEGSVLNAARWDDWCSINVEWKHSSHWL